MKALGIDYGTKKVGVAISDDTGSIAFPKAVLRNSHTLMGELRSMSESSAVTDIVVGQSLNTDGTENLVMEDIKGFIKRLEKESGLPVHLEPEFFTSEEARKGEVSLHMLDAAAAALILQRFLDKQKASR